MPHLKRPEPGTTTTREIKVRLCAECGNEIDEGGLCDYDCPWDGRTNSERKTFVAVYERTDKFLRDEGRES
jgi:hypothetical protein